MQARAAAVQQCVLGYYRIPPTAEEPLEVVVNPQGVEARSKVSQCWVATEWVCLCPFCNVNQVSEEWVPPGPTAKCSGCQECWGRVFPRLQASARMHAALFSVPSLAAGQPA